MCPDLGRLDKFFGPATACEATVIIHSPLITISRIYSTFYELRYRNGLLHL
jgi:hypothetical protein